jgi:hypothetical protein
VKMKLSFRVLVPVIVLVTLFVSACTAAPAASGGDKVSASPVEFTGVIESINGNQWVVNGQMITVDPSVVGNGPFVVGDTVKVEVKVQTDGSILVTRVEAPVATGNSNDSNSNDVNSNDANGNDTNSNDANANSSNSNDNGGLVMDNSNSEAFGTVESITTDTVVIGGQTFTLTNGAQLTSQIQAGDFVKVHFQLNADGTMTIIEIQTWDPAQVSNDNSNSNTSIDNNGNSSNANSNGNEDGNNSNDSNSNSDDHESNSNDDSGSGGNDNGGNGNSN